MLTVQVNHQAKSTIRRELRRAGPRRNWCSCAALLRANFGSHLTTVATFDHFKFNFLASAKSNLVFWRIFEMYLYTRTIVSIELHLVNKMIFSNETKKLYIYNISSWE